MQFGGIELGGALGGYEIINKPASTLPQDLASAISVVNAGKLGATYDPLWLVGKQLVNGMNYLLICKQIRSTKNADTAIVGVIVNIPPGSIDGKGATAARIIEEEKLSPELEAAFADAKQQLRGVEYKAILYMGSEVVHGVNHYIVCEAKNIYPGADPRPVILGINICDNKVSITGVVPIKDPAQQAPGLFGYAFSW